METTGINTCGTIHLESLQAILPAVILQCKHRKKFLIFLDIITSNIWYLFKSESKSEEYSTGERHTCEKEQRNKNKRRSHNMFYFRP